MSVYRSFTQSAAPKFIALVLSLSLAATAFSSAPARADDDVLKFIAGAAAIGIIGAAINDAKDDRHHSRSVGHSKKQATIHKHRQLKKRQQVRYGHRTSNRYSKRYTHQKQSGRHYR